MLEDELSPAFEHSASESEADGRRLVASAPHQLDTGQSNHIKVNISSHVLFYVLKLFY